MARRYKCPYCDDKYERKDLIDHVDKKHEDLIPENFTSTRIVFNLINKRECGFCRVCNKETKWREDLGRYDILCENPKCKEELRRRYQENMIRVRGTDNILNDPEQQKKMLANRSISGKYKFTDGGVLTFTGSYEKKCLEFMDKVLEIPSKDILSPGPTLEYEMNEEKHFYITDFYLIPQNLIIEVKDGGDNLNTKDTPGMRSSRERTLAKEKLITESGEYNYVRLTNNNFAQLLDVLMEIKEAQFDKRDGKIIKVNESYITESLDIDFNTPEELSNWMKKNIKYKEYDKLMSAKEVYDTKHGSCHDQVVFEDEIFKNMKIKHGKLFFIEYNEGEQQGGKTHTLLYYIKDNKYYWFENAWGGEEGIHGPYDSLSSLKDDVKERNMKNSNYDNIEFSTVKNIKTGMTLGEYVGACLKQTESVVNEVFRGTPMKSDLDPNFIPKDKFYLNDFTKKKIDKVFLNKYKNKYKTLKHVDPKNNGYVWMDDDKVVGYCSVDRDKELPWITALEVTEEYKGHGLGEQLLDYAVNELGGQALTVAKDNMIAKRMYDNYGFKVSKTSQEKADAGESAALFMYLDPSKSYLVESIIDCRDDIVTPFFEKNDVSANLDKFDPNGSNILYVTGMSGSGKSTLGKALREEFDCYRIEMDYVGVCFFNKYTEDKRNKKYEKILEEAPKDVLKWIKENQNRYSVYSWSETEELFKDFVKWFENTHLGDGNLYIMNGSWFIDFFDVEFFETRPVIVKDPSIIKSVIRRTNREVNGNLYDKIKGLYSNIKFLTSKSYRYSSLKAKKLIKYISEEGLYLTEYVNINESSMPFKLYHGSKYLFDELRPFGIDFGNSFQDAGWSLFTWTNYKSAMGWGCWEVFRHLNKIDNNIILNGCLNSQTTVVLQSVYNYLKENINRYSKEDLTFYVYTIPTKTEYEYGLGHSSNTPNCLTIRTDHIKYSKVDKYIMDIDMVDEYCKIVPDEYKLTSKDYGKNKRLTSFLMKYDFMYQPKLKKSFNNAIANGELNPGDNLISFLKDNNIDLKSVSFKERMADIISREETSPTQESELSYLTEYININETKINSPYLEKGDSCFNLDLWEPNNQNILYIVGMSGSGKTTLGKDVAKEFNCSRVELDNIEGFYLTRCRELGNQQKTYEEVKRECPEAAEFLLDKKRNREWVVNTWGEGAFIAKEFIDWFIPRVQGNGKLYILNGAQITTFLQPEYFADKPIIIKDINIMKSLTRRTIRSIDKYNNVVAAENFLRALKMYFNKNYRKANSDLKKYRKDLSNLVNESYINESSSITLYHGTDNPDFDLILPNSYNVGTHTSKPRMSSYWFDNAEYAKIFATMTVLDNNLPKDPNGRVCLDNDMSILVPNKYKITTINLLKNSNGYIYYRTITNKSVISRGHARYFPEYTIDVPIKPDGIIKVSYKDMINNIKFIDQEYYEEVMHKYATDNIRYDVSVLQQIFDIITKYSTGDIPKRKRELNKLAKFNSLGESVESLNESDIEYLNNYIL